MKIHDYTTTGSYKDDAKIIETKEKMQVLLEEQMRSAGRVPVLSMNPVWRTSWDRDREAYNFEMTMFGVFVGKRKAREIIGWDQSLDKWYNV